jgi:type II secretory pathway pseudopilin PulG
MRRRRGLSLAETVLAVGLVGVAVLSLLLVFTNGMRLLTQSGQMTVATDIGREFMEQVRANGAALVVPGVYDSRQGDAADVSTGFPPYPYIPAAPLKRAKGEYYLVVTADNTGLPPSTVAVKVEVYWNDSNRIVLETFLRS